MATTPARTVNLLDGARKPFLEVADKISDALVYLDAAFGEAAYYNLGLSFLYGLGAKAICALEDASINDAVAASIGGGSAKLDRLVIFTGRLLSDSHRHILRALRAHRDTRKCTIFCALSEAAHADYPGGLLSLDAYSQYEQLLREDLEKSLNTQTPGEESKPNPTTHNFRKHAGREEGGDGWDGWSDEDQRPLSNVEPSGMARTPEGGLGELSRALREARRSQEPEDSWEADRDEWAEERDAAENKDELEISVQFFSGLFCSLAPGAFVLPSAAAVTQAPLSLGQDPEGEVTAAECLGRGLPSVGGALGGVEALPAGVPLLAHGLGELLARLDLKPELFSLGPTSQAVTKAMTDLPTVETRSSVGVVLVDRTLDLLTPASHADNFFDRLAAALPQRPSVSSTIQNRENCAQLLREPLDFQVPLGKLFPSSPLMKNDFSDGSKVLPRRESEPNGRSGVTIDETPSSSQNGVNKLGDGGQWLGGALFQPSDAQAMERMESFLLRRNSKDALMALRRALQEAVRSEKLPAPRLKLGPIGPSEIFTLLAPLESQPRLALKHRALIQLARASAHALGAPHGPLWETLASTEKIMALSAAEDVRSLVAQLKELVTQNKTEVERGDTSVIGLRDILTLAAVAYSLAGDLSPSNRRSSTGGPVESPFPWEDELALQEAVVDAVLAGPQPTRLGFVDGLEASLEALWEKRREEKEKEKGGKTDGTEREGNKAAEESTSGEGGGLVESTKRGDESSREKEGEGNEGGWEDTHDGWDADWGVDEEDPPGTSSDEKAYDEVRLRLEVKDRVEEVFGKLRLVAAARQRLHGFQYLDQGAGALGATTTGLLKQLVARICAREEVPGLEHAASAVKKLLQTGLGRFGFQNFQSGPKPGDCKVVLVFVVGGLTLGEVKDVREALLPSPGQEGPEIIVGGTTLLTPEKLYKELFDKLR